MKKNEIGRIGQYRFDTAREGSVFFEEFLPELRGIRGVQVFQEMSENDETIGAILFAIEMLMRQVDIHVEPGGDKDIDKQAAEFVESCMNDMDRTWADTFSEILSFLTYGWSYHEIVYKRRSGKTGSPITNSKYNDGLIGWRKLPIRSQDTLYGWVYKDDTDELIGMTQAPPPNYEHLTIPLDKALHFRTRSRKDNPEGRSILRNSYRAWYFKKRIQEIEGIGIERDLAGFPVLYAPADLNIWDSEDYESMQALARAERIVTSIRRDAREGLVLPGGENGWKLELISSGSRRQFDTNAIIDRYDKRIATSVLADFVMLGQQQVGSFALADSKTKIFALAIGTYLDVICETFNNQGIPRLIDINGDHFKGISDYPKMVHGDIEEPDIMQFANYIKEMVGIGALEPDEAIQDEIRRVGKLPERVETKTPAEPQPGEENPQQDGTQPGTQGKKTDNAYKITSIVDKYQNHKITRQMAGQLLNEIGIDDKMAEFYLHEADAAKEEKKAEQESKPTQPRNAGNQNQASTIDEDAEDEKQAVEARKSLGRSLKWKERRGIK